MAFGKGGLIIYSLFHPSIKHVLSLDKKRREFQTVKVPHTPEARLAAARDLAMLKEGKSEAVDLSDPLKKTKPKLALFAPDGRVLQRNEGKHAFKWDIAAKTITLNVEISKFLDTSLIEVDVHTNWLRVTIKGKILQLLIEEDVQTEKVICERSRLTGQLAITMLKAVQHGDIEECRKMERLESLKKEADEKTRLANVPKPSRQRKYEKLLEPREAVDYKNIINKNATINKIASHAGKIMDAPVIKADMKIDQDFVDDPSVPPLC